MNKPTCPSLLLYVLVSLTVLMAFHCSVLARTVSYLCQPSQNWIQCCRFVFANGKQWTQNISLEVAAPNAPQLGTIGKCSHVRILLSFSQWKLLLLLKEVNCFALTSGSNVVLGVVLILTQICLAIQFVSRPHKWLFWQKRMDHENKSDREKAGPFSFMWHFWFVSAYHD